MIFRVLGFLAVGISVKTPSNFAVLVFFHIAVAGRELSGRYYGVAVVKRHPVLGGIWRSFVGLPRLLLFL